MSIIKDNIEIREALFKRITELQLTLKDVTIQAERQFGRKIHPSQLSRYFSETPSPGPKITEDDVIWLCIRYGIDISLDVKLNRYNEKTRIHAIRRRYPRG